MAGGIQVFNPNNSNNPNVPVNKKMSGPLDLYGNAVQAQGSDYDSLMSKLDQLYNQNTNAPQVNYSSSPDVTNALGALKNFSETGGYSSSDVNNLRERAISPIRSIYSNAKDNLDRQKSLQGGYSPGYGASVARMARDSSGQIGKATTDANANIAQMIQSGKMGALNPYASLASGESGRSFDASQMNANLANTNQNRLLDILKTKQSLYGTSPALVNTFGNQALNTAQMNQNQNQFNTRTQQTNNLAKLAQVGRL
jgi:hypothetical protein